MKNEKTLEEMDLMRIAEEDEKVSEMRKRFFEKDGKWFRISSRNEPLNIDQLSLQMYCNQQISKYKKEIENAKAEGDISFWMKKIEEEKDLMKKYVIPTESKINEKSNFSNFDKELFIILTDNKLELTTGFITGAIQEDVQSVIHENDFKTDKELCFIATKAFKTAITKLSDYKFGKISIEKSQLELEIYNTKTGKSEYYGILGHKTKK